LRGNQFDSLLVQPDLEIVQLRRRQLDLGQRRPQLVHEQQTPFKCCALKPSSLDKACDLGTLG
jgi:hypothetical protein